MLFSINVSDVALLGDYNLSFQLETTTKDGVVIPINRVKKNISLLIRLPPALYKPNTPPYFTKSFDMIKIIENKTYNYSLPSVIDDENDQYMI